MAHPLIGTLNRSRRDRWAAGAVLLMLVVVMLWALLHAEPSSAEEGLVAAGSPAGHTRSAPRGSDDWQALHQRCTLAMVNGTCRVMRPAASQVPALSRVFIAGLGEVDAAVYRQLRQQGDAMCEDVVAACRTESAGPACRMAQALYPETH